MYNIAIIAVSYNRVASTKRLLESLLRAYYNDANVSLIISIDKSNTSIVEEYADSFTWPFGIKIVDKHEKNLGLRHHMLSLGKWFEKFDALIVLEDDITVSPYFYIYAKECVSKYKDCLDIAGISLYNFPINYQNGLPFAPVVSQFDVYMMNCAQSWGQIWMPKQWTQFMSWYNLHNEEFDISELPASINKWPKSSWLKYHTRYCIEENKYFVYPYVSLSANNNDPGTHVKKQEVNYFQSVLRCLPYSKIKLPNFDECVIKYDGFFEPKFLASYLKITSDNLCVDLFGFKPECLYKRYVLSRKSLSFKVVKSFGFNYKPLEANVIFDCPGEGIYLYDTDNKTKTAPKQYDQIFFYYLFGKSVDNMLKLVGIREPWRTCFNMFKKKLKRLI